MEDIKEIVYKEGDLVFKEKYIKEGIEKTRKRSSLYSIILVGTLLLNACAANSAIAAIPNLVYEPSYLCKETNSIKDGFTKKCQKEFVCDSYHVEGVDYILDIKKFKRSLVTDYGIYCSNFKISTFGTSYFFGGVIGLIIWPFLLKDFGNISTINYASFVCIICNFFLLIINNYWLGITVFTISMIARSILQVPSVQYSVEMVRPDERRIILGLMVAMNSFSGLILNLMDVTVGDYKGEIISNTFLFLISIILVHFLLVDSSSNTFVRGKYKQIIDDLDHISKINASQKEFKEWKDKIYEDSKLNNENSLHVNEIEGKKNKFDLVDYISIWRLKGVTVKLIIFTFFFFTSQFNLIFLFYEVQNVPNFFFISTLCYLIDIAGFFFGTYIINVPQLGRRYSSIIFNIAAGISYVVTAIVLFYTGNFYLIFLNRFLNSTLQKILVSYVFESFPTVLRPYSTAITRIAGRLFNIPSPILMINYRFISYILVGVLNILLAWGIYYFEIEETLHKEIEELNEEFKNPEYLKSRQLKHE